MSATNSCAGMGARVAETTSQRQKRDAASRRFVKALLRSGQAMLENDSVVIDDGPGTRASLAQDALRALESQGLVRVTNGVCTPTPECAAWLRRALAETDVFSGQHRELTQGPEGSQRDLANSPLDKLAHAVGGSYLAPHQLAAGQRVCQWGARAQLRQRITMSYDPAQVGGRRHGAGSVDITDMAAEARTALARLFRDLPRDCAEVIVDVCVFEKGLQAIETERGWPRRSAKLVLRIGLDRLAASLGLSPEAVGQPSRRRHDWQDTGFQPTRFE